MTTSVYLTLFQSCEDLLSYKASVCSIEFLGFTRLYNTVQPDTLTTEAGFRVVAYPNEDCYNMRTFSFIAPCYATTKCAKWQNEIVQSSFKLSFDRQLIIFNDTILPNIDLFQNTSFVNAVEVSKYDSECKSIEYYIKFKPDMLDDITFEKGIYKATFICNTNDNKIFTKLREVIFKL